MEFRKPLSSKNFVIRKACIDDLDALNSLANSNKNELGFVRKVTIAKSIMSDEVILVQEQDKILGFVRYHHRLNLQTTLYDIVVNQTDRGKGVGKLLINSLVGESQYFNKECIRLKCPIDLESNNFYQYLGFEKEKQESGKKRSLFIWKLSL